ncbi:MAG: EI24 domain-containing protein, partial [Burkholderiales bacterium]|nr:EI24 domain-containing protein [Burkholderiales bacterium]
GLFWSLASTCMALLAMLASLPLWLIPPLIMVLPPLIWGWLTYRVFAYDVLADHASVEERKALFAQHRHQFLVLGIITGYLGALPSVLWASGAMFIAMAPLLIPLAIWIYTLVFAFSALWFAHFGLGALVRLREADAKALAKAHDWAVQAAKTPPAVVDVPGPAGTPTVQAALPPMTHPSQADGS